jgi:hypothetical protein
MLNKKIMVKKTLIDSIVKLERRQRTRKHLKIKSSKKI